MAHRLWLLAGIGLGLVWGGPPLPAPTAPAQATHKPEAPAKAAFAGASGLCASAGSDAEDADQSAACYGCPFWPGQEAAAQVNHGGHQQRGTTGQGLRQ